MIYPQTGRSQRFLFHDRVSVPKSWVFWYGNSFEDLMEYCYSTKSNETLFSLMFIFERL